MKHVYLFRTLVYAIEQHSRALAPYDARAETRLESDVVGGKVRAKVEESFGGGRRPSMGHRASSALRSFGRGRQASRRLSNGATPSFPPLLAPYGTRIHVSQRSKGSVEARDQAEVLLCFCP